MNVPRMFIYLALVKSVTLTNYNDMQINAKDLFVSSDFHFFHSNIIKYCRRPFSTVEEMNETMIRNWNEVVPIEGTGFILGDFCFGSVDNAIKVLKRLNGRKVLVSGNHDKRNLKDPEFCSQWDLITPYLEVEVVDDEGRKAHQLIVMCHYAFKVWNQSHRQSWALWGHSHGTLPDDPKALSLDVGVDGHEYKPWTYKELKARMAQKSWKAIDHHGAD